MARSINGILEGVAGTLNALPGVFSTPQWGGRAYKLPGPGGSVKRPKLLAFVCLSKDGSTIIVTFKLDKQRAAQVIATHSWIVRESFGSLGGAGWVRAKVAAAAHVRTLAPLLAESRGLYPAVEPAIVELEPAGAAATGELARRIAKVMQLELPDGWTPPRDDDFASAPPAPTKRRGTPARKAPKQRR
jgi:hypothetical protein